MIIIAALERARLGSGSRSEGVGGGTRQYSGAGEQQQQVRIVLNIIFKYIQ
jgi:hypothetical protein